MNAENDERLWLILDQLSSRTSLSRREWYVTTAALRSLEKLLLRISFGNSEGTATFGDIAYPTHQNSLFTWFLSAQDDFRSNLASHLLAFLRLLADQSDVVDDDEERKQYSAWTCRSLNALQGALLLHEPSRSLFTRRPHMKFLTNYLSLDHDESIHIEAIQTIVSALVDRPDNLRILESTDGLKSVSELFLHDQTGHKVKVKVLEFLYFYLTQEVPTTPSQVQDPGSLGDSTLRRASELSVASTVKIRQHAREPAGDEYGKHERRQRKTTEEKQLLLGQYFSNIDALVKDLNEFKPFGEF